MDLETPLATLETYFPEEMEQVISSAAFYFPEKLSGMLRHAVAYLPAEIDMMASAQFILFFTAASLVFGVLGRIVLGKRSSLNRSLSSAVGILFIYVFTVVIYTLKPWNLEALLSPLPFVTFSGEYLIIFPITNARFPALCSEVLSLILLAFLVNLSDTILPQGKHMVTWYLTRFFSVAVSMVLHLLARELIHQYLPNVLTTYAPTVLLLLLMFMLLSGLFSLILGLVISVGNPFLGAMYTFFFSSVIGKQLSKAIFSSMVLCVVVFLLDFFDYTVLCITASTLLTYIPLVFVLLALWYLMGHVL